jgi:DNA-binding response OmpR family regulator
MQKTIYIAEDEGNIRILIKSFLANAGYEVQDFETGDRLLDAFEEKPADLVVLDVVMPGMSGYNVCRQLRENSAVPIIMMTARDSDLDRQAGFDLGCNEFLVKPVSPGHFVKRVQSILCEETASLPV